MQSPAFTRRVSGSIGTPALSLPVAGSRSALRTYMIAVGSCNGPDCPPMVISSPSSGSMMVTCGMLTGRGLYTRVPPFGLSAPPTCMVAFCGSPMVRPSGFGRMSLASAATISKLRLGVGRLPIPVGFGLVRGQMPSKAVVLRAVTGFGLFGNATRSLRAVL
ncbi:hypothetical protein D9M71_629240 [compost metagenome]